MTHFLVSAIVFSIALVAYIIALAYRPPKGRLEVLVTYLLTALLSANITQSFMYYFNL